MAPCSPSLVRRAVLLAFVLAACGPAAAQPAVRVAPGVAVPAPFRALLSEVLEEAGVRSARVSSGPRTPDEQVRVMYGYVRRHGAGAAKQLYGPEGDAVVDAYLAHRTAPEAEVLRSMLEELRRQLPSALANKRLMHLHPCYDTFDVAMSSIPAGRRDAFVQAARRHPGVHRVLGPEEGEREAFHVEVPRPGACAAGGS